jgi:hypothetical protein
MDFMENPKNRRKGNVKEEIKMITHEEMTEIELGMIQRLNNTESCMDQMKSLAPVSYRQIYLPMYLTELRNLRNEMNRVGSFGEQLYGPTHSLGKAKERCDEIIDRINNELKQ